MKLFKNLTASCFAIFILVISILLGFVGKVVWQIHLDQENAILKVSNRLNVPANAESIKDFVYCDLLYLGESIVEVETNLAKIDTYHVYGESKVKRYSFNDPNINDLIGEIHLTYDDNWLLAEKGKRAGFGDYTLFNCDP